MGRLIDDNLLKKRIKKWLKPSKPEEDEYISITDALVSTLQEIEEQPTAFDLDKVVEQLNDKFRVVRTDEDLEWNRAMDEAITIVKGDGVDGN